MTDETEPNASILEQEQNYIESKLNRGTIFAVFWAAGVGSFIAFRNGIQCLRLIRQSDHKLTGTGRAIWCIVVGGAGLLIWIPIFIFLVFR